LVSGIGISTALFSGTGVSPAAGLYDGAGNPASGGTAFNASSGVLEIGKKRYIHEANCATTANVVYNGIVEITNSATTIKTCNDAQSGQTWQSSSSILTFDTFAKRYIHEANCWAATNTVYSGIKTTDNNSTTTLDCNNIQSGQTWQGLSGIRDISTLGGRYIHEANCWSSNNIIYSGIVTINNTSTLALDCNAVQTGQTWLGTSSLRSIDTLDASRSKSFIEYEMLIPSTAAAANYGTTSTLASTATTAEFTSVTSGVNGSGVTVVPLNITVDPDLPSGPGSIGNSTDCTAALSLPVGSNYTCTFPISGTGNFVLPAGGISAKTNQTTPATVNSTPVSSCVIAGATLVCTGIKTNGGLVPGSGNVQLGKGATPTWNTKGAITLTNYVTTDLLFIDPSKVSFSPVESSAIKFGSGDLTLTVNPNTGSGATGDTRLTRGGTTAVCKFRLKEFGVADSDATRGFDASLSKLAGSVADLDLTNNSFDVAYSETTGCSVKLPAGTAQNQPKWFFETRVVRSDTQVFGRDNSYFMTYGAIGGVSIS